MRRRTYEPISAAVTGIRQSMCCIVPLQTMIWNFNHWGFI